MSSTIEDKWFEEWFNTKYYHILYKNRDHQEAEEFILKLLDELQLPSDAYCLDLACGKGRHARFLSEQGFKVCGVDLSENSIQFASQWCNDNLYFDVHDMREVYKKNAYDAVFNLFTSFGYFDSDSDNLRVLDSIHQMLCDKGILVIDFLNAEKVVSNLVKSETKYIDGVTFKIKRWVEDGHIYKQIDIHDEGKELSFTERVQALYRSDFERMLEAKNFSVKNVFGSLDLAPFQDATSDRLVIIAEKK